MQAPTAAKVDLYETDNATMQDAYQLGVVGDVSWSFTGMSFKMEVKASRDDTLPLVTWTSGGGQIVVLDAVQRILQFNIPDTVLQTSLPPGQYVYDLIMLDGSSPPIRSQLMFGHLFISHGVTED